MIQKAIDVMATLLETHLCPIECRGSVVRAMCDLCVALHGREGENNWMTGFELDDLITEVEALRCLVDEAGEEIAVQQANRDERDARLLD